MAVVFTNSSGLADRFTDIDNVLFEANQSTGGLLCNGSCLNGSISDGSATAQKKLVLVILNYINYILLPIILVFGLTGNSLTVLVLRTRRYAHLTSRLFLIALALSDTMLLLTQPFNKLFIIQLFGRDLRALSLMGCKIYFVLFKTAKMTSSWFLVFLCLERFVAVWFPLKAKFIVTKKVAYYGIALVYVVQISYNSVWSYASKISDDGLCHPDTYDKTNPEEVAKFGRFVVTGCILYSLLPMACMIILTPLIIFKLYSHTQKRRSLTGKMQKRQDDSRRTTLMLVGVVIAYVLLIFPVTMLHMGAFILRLNAFGVNDIGFLVYRDVSQILEQINYAINFILYVVASSTFRQGLRETLNLNKFSYLNRNKSNTSGSSFTGVTSIRQKQKENKTPPEGCDNKIFRVEDN